MSVPVIHTNVYQMPQTCCVRQVDDPQYGQVTDHWVPVRTGDWGKDNTIGRVYAQRTVAYIQDKDCTVMLTTILRTIVQKGHCDAVEIGFIQEVAERLMRSG